MQTEFYKHLEQEEEGLEIEALLKEQNIPHQISSATPILVQVI